MQSVQDYKKTKEFISLLGEMHQTADLNEAQIIKNKLISMENQQRTERLDRCQIKR